MAITPKLADGESFVRGRSSATARRLIELADAADLSGTVRTTSHGYIVPSSLVGEYDAKNAVVSGEVIEDEANQFDPSKATVDEVNDYLAGTDDAERERVLAAETEGKKRKGILDSADTSEGDK
jgi:hypothetical protein